MKYKNTIIFIIFTTFLSTSLFANCNLSQITDLERKKEGAVRLLARDNDLNNFILNKAKECEEDGSLKCRVSFIGYRDINEARRFEVKPFSDNIDEVKKYISEVKADGGADEPEDMQGGLKLCLLQDWTEEAIKRVVIITDAPPHGKQYHGNRCSDDFPNGSPEGI